MEAINMDNNENMNNKTDIPVMEAFHGEKENSLPSINELIPEIEKSSLEFLLKNTFKATGTTFEIPRENEAPIIITSSENIEVEIEYSSRAISLFIKCNSTISSTSLSISGFMASLHKYEDHYSNYEELVPDKDGKITFNQDISKNHFILLQLTESTYILTEDGWSPSGVGTWDPITRVATLLVEGNQTIEIQTDDVILNGFKSDNTRYTIDGSINKLSNGIFVNGRKEIAICNFEIKNCDIGVRILNSEDISINNNLILDPTTYGIYLDSTTKVNIIKNSLLNGYTGILLNTFNEFVTIEQNTIIPSQYGIYIINYNIHTKVLNNLISKSTTSQYLMGIFLSSSNNYSRFENNVITLHDENLTSTTINLYGIYTGSGNNSTTAINNKVKICNNNFQIPENSNFYNYFYGILINGFMSDKTVIKSNEIIVENNSFTSENSYIYTLFYGIYSVSNYSGCTEIQCNKIYFKNNFFSPSPSNANSISFNIRCLYCGNSYNGISISHNNIQVSNNTLVSAGGSVDSRIYGTILYYNLMTEFKDNRIVLSNNSIASSMLYGLYLDSYCNTNLLCDNEIKIQNNLGNLFYSISLYRNNNRNEIVNNTLSYNQGTAIYLLNYNNENVIKHNSITNNKENGIHFVSYNRYNKISNNTISDNGKIGILFEAQSNKNIIDCNNIIDNSTGLYFSAGSSYNHVDYNNFINGDNHNGFNYGSDNYFYSNYWSDWNGIIPYNVNGVVDYKPLTTPINICEKSQENCTTDSWI